MPSSHKHNMVVVVNVNPCGLHECGPIEHMIKDMIRHMTIDIHVVFT
jgi:hypothetical protein